MPFFVPTSVDNDRVEFILLYRTWRAKLSIIARARGLSRGNFACVRWRFVSPQFFNLHPNFPSLSRIINSAFIMHFSREFYIMVCACDYSEPSRTASWTVMVYQMSKANIAELSSEGKHILYNYYIILYKYYIMRSV